jgi:hypothetical protein
VISLKDGSIEIFATPEEVKEKRPDLYQRAFA